jgi:hypothetical protein
MKRLTHALATLSLALCLAFGNQKEANSQISAPSTTFTTSICGGANAPQDYFVVRLIFTEFNHPFGATVIAPQPSDSPVQIPNGSGWIATSSRHPGHNPDPDYYFTYSIPVTQLVTRGSTYPEAGEWRTYNLSNLGRDWTGNELLVSFFRESENGTRADLGGIWPLQIFYSGFANLFTIGSAQIGDIRWEVMTYLTCSQGAPPNTTSGTRFDFSANRVFLYRDPACPSRYRCGNEYPRTLR